MGKALLMNYLKLPPYMVVLIALIFVGLAIGFIKLINKRHYKVLRQVAKVGVLLSVLLILVINIIKIFWGENGLDIWLHPIVVLHAGICRKLSLQIMSSCHFHPGILLTHRLYTGLPYSIFWMLKHKFVKE